MSKDVIASLKTRAVASQADQVVESITPSLNKTTKIGDRIEDVEDAAVDAGRATRRMAGGQAAQDSAIPKGGVTIEQRIAQGGNVPEYARRNPSRYYYDLETSRYKVRPIASAVGNALVERHHPLPKFLGGSDRQLLTNLDSKTHTEFHRLLQEKLKGAGIPLNVGGRGGSAADWARYMTANPGSQRKAFDAVLGAARAIDAKHGTTITQDVWNNIVGQRFTPLR